MARTIDHIGRISESFDALDSMSQSDILCELFTRLTDPAKAEALRRINNHARMEGLAPKEKRRNGKDAEPVVHDNESDAWVRRIPEELEGKP